jgi:hypothetical protein
MCASSFELPEFRKHSCYLGIADHKLGGVGWLVVWLQGTNIRDQLSISMYSRNITMTNPGKFTSTFRNLFGGITVLEFESLK